MKGLHLQRVCVLQGSAPSKGLRLYPPMSGPHTSSFAGNCNIKPKDKQLRVGIYDAAVWLLELVALFKAGPGTGSDRVCLWGLTLTHSLTLRGATHRITDALRCAAEIGWTPSMSIYIPCDGHYKNVMVGSGCSPLRYLNILAAIETSFLFSKHLGCHLQLQPPR